PHAAVGVDDDLAPGEARIAHRPADDEAAGRVDVDLRLRRPELLRHRGMDDLRPDGLLERLPLHGLVVLRRDHDRVDGDGPIVLVAHRDLALAVGPEEVDAVDLLLAHLGEAPGELVGELDGAGHELLRLVAGVAEHHALVAGALRPRIAAVDAARDV